MPAQHHLGHTTPRLKEARAAAQKQRAAALAETEATAEKLAAREQELANVAAEKRWPHGRPRATMLWPDPSVSELDEAEPGSVLLEWLRSVAPIPWERRERSVFVGRPGKLSLVGVTDSSS